MISGSVGGLVARGKYPKPRRRSRRATAENSSVNAEPPT